MSNKEQYELWCKCATKDEDVANELREICGKEEEINDRFYRKLEFGTGGLRGVIGAGTNRMNVYTVNQATQGLADYLNENYDSPSVAIAYDSRIKSDTFAKSAAGVLAANGIKVYIYNELVPTPMLSFAVRYHKCQSGIMITASHNPAKYNGYKCYEEHGYQMTDEGAATTLKYIQQTDIFTGVKEIDFNAALESGKIEIIGEEVFEAFYSEVAKQLNADVFKSSDLKVIYTPLNGTGNKPVRHMLKAMGLENVFVVPEQENPNGNFPTCPFPNPEIQQAFECAIALSKDKNADLLLATDPDCDRVGIAVNRGDNTFRLLSGNETGAIMAKYMLEQRKAKGISSDGAYIVKTIVTSKLIDKIAEEYGCNVANLLTGFKYIGEFITQLEEKGEEDKYILGMEESYGYLAGIHARDKDAVVASTLICEMACYYKNKGLSLIDVLEGIYAEYGYFKNTLLNFQFEGESGMKKMQGLMDSLRENAPTEIADSKVVTALDYLKSESVDTATGNVEEITLPKSNVLEYRLANGNSAIIRPSGTEPKIKIYITACEKTAELSEKASEDIGNSMRKILGLD